MQSSIGTGYDLSTSTYSPDGRIFQVRPSRPLLSWTSCCRPASGRAAAAERDSWKVADTHSLQVEYANKAVENAGTVIGLRCKDGIVLAVEKLVLSKLLVPGANKRIATVDRHAGLVRRATLAKSP